MTRTGGGGGGGPDDGRGAHVSFAATIAALRVLPSGPFAAARDARQQRPTPHGPPPTWAGAVAALGAWPMATPERVQRATLERHERDKVAAVKQARADELRARFDAKRRAVEAAEEEEAEARRGRCESGAWDDATASNNMRSMLSGERCGSRARDDAAAPSGVRRILSEERRAKDVQWVCLPQASSCAVRRRHSKQIQMPLKAVAPPGCRCGCGCGSRAVSQRGGRCAVFCNKKRALRKHPALPFRVSYWKIPEGTTSSGGSRTVPLTLMFFSNVRRKQFFVLNFEFPTKQPLVV
jgi:hypothetical protein